MIGITLRAVLLEGAGVATEFGARVYSPVAPDAPTYPYITIQKVAGVGSYDFQGDVRLERARMQVDVFTDNGQEELERLALIVRRRLSGFKGGPVASPCVIQSCMCITDSDVPEFATERAGPKLRRRLLEFEVWNTEV